MPTIREKQPRWLMGCKCGARVKASRDSAGITHLGSTRRGCATVVRKMGTAGREPETECLGLRNDGGLFERRHGRVRRCSGLSRPVEQHPPFERARTQERIAD